MKKDEGTVVVSLMGFLERKNARLRHEIEMLERETQALAEELACANSRPPKRTEFLLTMLATTRGAEAMIGDLNERFTGECREFGRDRAVRLYWARTLRSLPPLVWRAIGKLVVAMVKRFFGHSGA